MENDTPTTRHQILIIGGGTAGITAAARLKKADRGLDIAIIDPAETHFYQPMWTLIGGGVFEKKRSGRPMKSVIPAGVTWLKTKVTTINADQNQITCEDGKTVSYDYLIVVPGLQVNFGAIPGLAETVGKNGVCSNYSFQYVDYTWECVKNFKGGTALFTHPSGAVKCGGAPQKICYLAEDYFRKKSGVRDQSKVIFSSALGSIFAVKCYRETLEKVIRRKEIDARFNTELTSIDGPGKKATLTNSQTGESEEVAFEMIHVTPPMGPPGFIKSSPLAAESGWVDVDPQSMRHTNYANVFSMGDVSNLPTSKTGAAIRKQAPVLVSHLLADLRGVKSSASYDGYTSCPLVTGYGSLVMAEFDYEGNTAESFPIDQSKERWSMWFVKKTGLPWLYWNLMLKGKA